MKTATAAGVLLAVLWAVFCVPALGQRVQFPSTVAPAEPGPAPADIGPAPADIGPAPAATLEGTIQPPPPDWDPYATPGVTQPSLLPQDPYLQYGPPGGFGGTFTRMRRLLEEVRFDYVWMPGSAANELGINDLELSATFAIPFLYNTETPLLVTPGFAIHYWNGPETSATQLADLPPQVFDAYLDTAWNPQLTPWLGGELAFRIGVYSDFRKISGRSLRFPSKGLVVMSFSPSIQVKAGVMYLDRNRVKILPAGGVIWTPNPDTRFEILFPDPRVSRRLTAIGNTEWWAYARGEYGGGAWTVKRQNPVVAINDMLDSVDYNDLRFSVGLEFIRLSGLEGMFEVGLAFDREVRYRSLAPPVFYPNTTVFLRAGLAY